MNAVTPVPRPEPLLAVRNVAAFYGQFQALFGVSFEVEAGEIVSIIGANGAGKSTLMRAIVGQAPRMTGEITFAGRRIDGMSTREIIGAGIAHVPEGRRLFAGLSVAENLMFGLRARRGPGMALDEVYEMFPAVAERRRLRAGELSGGQQQMVAIGRALLSGPKVLLCDEISIGLSPAIVGQLYELFPKIAARGIGIVIVEQDLTRSLRVSRRFTCLLRGKVSLAGPSAAHSRDSIAPYYLGAAA